MKSKQTLTFDYSLRKPPALVEVEIDSNYPDFGIGLNPKYPGYREGKWAVFHVPSQMMATDSKTKPNCKRIVAELSGLGDWNHPKDGLAKELLIAAARYCLKTHIAEFSV